MDSSHTVNQIFNLLYTYSYFILFPLVVIEGPVVTIIAGFLASLNFLNPWIAFPVIVAGDLGGDVLYYSAGRWWLRAAFEKVLNFLGIKLQMVTKLEGALKRNRGMVLFFGKLSHAIGIPILFVAGHADVPFDEYIWFNFLATIPKSGILLLVGYFFGSTISNFRKALDYTVLGLFVFTLILIGLYFVITYFSHKFFGKIEK